MSTPYTSLLTTIAAAADRFSGSVGLAAQRLDGKQPLLFQADESFPTASVIKLVILVEYLAQVEAGTLDPDRRLVLQAADQVGGSGILKDLRPGLSLSLQDLATLAITVSDNTAANLLLETVGGLPVVNARLQALGMTSTTMGRPFVFGGAGDNTGTPADFLRLLLALGRRQLVSPAADEQLLALLYKQQYRSYIPRYLPGHPFAAEYGLPQPVTIANKVGMLRGTVNDAAIIQTDGLNYTLVIFTRGCRDDRPDPDNEAALLVAELSREVFYWFQNSVLEPTTG